MKRLLKLIILIIIIAVPLVLSGCVSDSDYSHILVYEIYWGGNCVEGKTITSDEQIIIGSYRGTNRIYTVEQGYVENTSAPIRKISYTKSRK